MFCSTTDFRFVFACSFRVCDGDCVLVLLLDVSVGLDYFGLWFDVIQIFGFRLVSGFVSFVWVLRIVVWLCCCFLAYKGYWFSGLLAFCRGFWMFAFRFSFWV